jgi:hypothetical protein
MRINIGIFLFPGEGKSIHAEEKSEIINVVKETKG